MIDSARDARRYALRLLGYRARSEREIRDRLRAKGFPEEAVSHTIASLQQSGFVDDAAFAREAMRQARQNRLMSHAGCRAFLIKRGLSREVIEATLDYDEDREYETAKRLFDKRVPEPAGIGAPEQKRRIWNFLARRGFSSATIQKVMRMDSSDTEDEA